MPFKRSAKLSYGPERINPKTTFQKPSAYEIRALKERARHKARRPLPHLTADLVSALKTRLRVRRDAQARCYTSLATPGQPLAARFRSRTRKRRKRGALRRHANYDAGVGSAGAFEDDSFSPPILSRRRARRVHRLRRNGRKPSTLHPSSKHYTPKSRTAHLPHSSKSLIHGIRAFSQRSTTRRADCKIRSS